MKISPLINKKMPTTVGIFIFISREDFMLSWVEHEKSLIISGPVFWEMSEKNITTLFLCAYNTFKDKKFQEK